MNDRDLQKCTLSWLSQAIRRKEVSPVEVTRACLDRIDEHDRAINAFISVRRKPALAAARAAEREILNGHHRGPLHGIPYAAKDLFLTKGLRTTCGSRILANFVPREDAALIERLARAGAILLGKLNMHEFAFGTTSVNPHYGAVRNPWDVARIAGGSSGGSAAAIAASFALLTLGTDTGGSIRIPSALCGVSGLKPTYGRLSRRGVYPLAWSLDHPGPMAKSAADLALAMTVLAGFDPGDPSASRAPVPDYPSALSGDLEGLRLGVPAGFYFDRLDSAVAARVDDAMACFRRLGADVRPVSIPLLPEASAAAAITLYAESSASLERWHRERAADLGADVRARLDLGATLTAAQYLKALRIRTRVRAAFGRVFEKVDALVTPQLPITAPIIGESHVRIGRHTEAVPDALTRFTRIGNLVGNPSLSVCCGFSADGLPIAVQLSAKPFDESTVLRIGDAYQRHARLSEAAHDRGSDRVENRRSR
jgi:aspartyl-tRNA(Asn)/glutamyl-tRNA(Gln) amidotransferase subunit A